MYCNARRFLLAEEAKAPFAAREAQEHCPIPYFHVEVDLYIPLRVPFVPHCHHRPRMQGLKQTWPSPADSRCAAANRVHESLWEAPCSSPCLSQSCPNSG